MNVKSKIFKYLIGLLIVGCSNACLIAQPSISYSFLVGGHAYGSHDGTNTGLHPTFISSLDSGIDTLVRFIVLTGDIVNHSNAESWQQVEKELDKYSLPYYYVMGNHDANDTGITEFKEKYGETYYSFQFQKELYIILNSNETLKSISENQVLFLREKLDEADDLIENVFIFFHEILWNSDEKYKGVKSNSRSRYENIIDYSNYWTEIHPILEEHSDKGIFVIAGDVAGNPDAVPAFFDIWGSIRLIASGMGEVEEENYLLVDVYENDSIAYRLIPLNEKVSMKNIAYYSVPNKPESIEGAVLLTSGQVNVQYSIAEVLNAQEYVWELPENAQGASVTNTIVVDFDNDFSSGTISVKAFHESFGESQASSLFVALKSNLIPTSQNTSTGLQAKVYKTGSLCKLVIESSSIKDLKITICDILGRVLHSEKTTVFTKLERQINLSTYSSGIYFISIEGDKEIVAESIWIY